MSQPQAIRRLQRAQGAAHLSFGSSGVQRWREDGAAKVRLPRRPKDAPAEAILINTAGGLTGGDRLDWTFDVDGIDLVATTQAAEKIYRSLGDNAEIRSRLTASSGAQLYWLPQEAILFDGARASIALRVEVASGARFIGWDMTCLGRTASGERYGAGSLRQSFELHRDGALVFCERTAVDGGSRALQSGALLGGAPVFGTMIVAGTAVPDPLLAGCRAVVCGTGVGAVTRLPEVFVARYRGDSAHAARTYFATLWRLLRPLVAGREAVVPRIFST